MKNKRYYIAKASERKARIKEFVENIKRQSGGCLMCGEDHIACLVFHHRNPSIKDDAVTSLCRDGAGLERIAKEIDKCDILCANCHRKKHWNERHISKVA